MNVVSVQRVADEIVNVQRLQVFQIRCGPDKGGDPLTARHQDLCDFESRVAGGAEDQYAVVGVRGRCHENRGDNQYE